MKSMYAVVHEPKAKYRQVYVIALQFVEASTKAEAIRQTGFKRGEEFKAPYAVAVQPGLLLRV